MTAMPPPRGEESPAPATATCPAAACPPLAPADRPRAAAVFALVLGIQLLTWGGWDVLYDNESTLRVAQALLHDHSIVITEPESGLRKTSVYGIGQSLLLLPAVLAADLVPPPEGTSAADWVRLLASLADPFVNALLGAVMFAIGRSLGLTVPRALFLGMLGVLGTPLWSLSSYTMSEPLVALCLMVATGAVASRGSAPRHLVVGVAFGLASLARPVALVAGPALLLGWLLDARRPPVDRRRVARGALAGAAGFLPLFGIFLAYNHARFGTFIQTSYGLPQGPNVLYQGKGGILEGIATLFLSDRVGAAWFAPVAVLGLLALPLLHRCHPTLAFVSAGVIALQVLLHARAGLWFGGPFWGPRFIAPVLPLAVLGTIPLLRRGGLAAATVLAVGTLSIAINGLGAMHDTVNTDRHVDEARGMMATQLALLSPTDLLRPATRPTSGTLWPTLTSLGVAILATIAAAALELARRSGRLRTRHVVLALALPLLFVALRERSIPYRLLAPRGRPAASSEALPLEQFVVGRGRPPRAGMLSLASPKRATLTLKLPRGAHRFRLDLEAQGPALYELRLDDELLQAGQLASGTRSEIVSPTLHVRRSREFTLVLGCTSPQEGQRSALLCRAISRETLDSGGAFRRYVLRSE